MFESLFTFCPSQSMLIKKNYLFIYLEFVCDVSLSYEH